MLVAAAPALLVAAATISIAFFARRLREGARSWPALTWAVLLVGGAVAAIVVRTVEAVVLELFVGRGFGRSEGVLSSIAAFGLVGPLTVASLAAVVWPALASTKARDDVDPPLAATVAAAAAVVGRILSLALLERAPIGSGVRLAIVAFDDIALAGTWGYGLALSGLDGRLGGTPFGRYALVAMLIRGALEVSVRGTSGIALPFMISVGVVLGLFAALGVRRLARHDDQVPSSLATVGQETIRELAREGLRKGAIRPGWIVVGALADLGGIVLGFLAAVYVGHRAQIDFGEIDRAGPAAEYAALLLAIGVIVSFPFSAAIVGIASGGRDRGARRAHVLEAGLSAIVALGALLFVLGVVAPVAVALGVACAPVAFVLAGLGAWIAAGRRV